MCWLVVYLGVSVVLWCWLVECFGEVVVVVVLLFDGIVVMGSVDECVLVDVVCECVGLCVVLLVGVLLFGEFGVLIEMVDLLLLNNSGFVYFVVVFGMLVVDLYVLINL